MQKIVTKYGLAAHLAILAVAPLFLSETAILWVAALVAVSVIMEPSRVGQEMLHDARHRVARSLVRDPLFWVGLCLTVLAAVRALNSGIALVYDAEVAKWSLSSPGMEILPGSVAGAGGWHFATVCVGMLVVAMGCRHALGRSARGAFALLVSFLAGVVALARLVSAYGHASALTDMMSCASTNPVYDGCAYGIFFLLSIAAMADVFERRWWRSLPMSAFGVLGTAVGLFFFAPIVVSLAYAAAAAVMLLYVFVYLRVKVSKTADFRCLVVCGLTMVFAGMAAMTIAPDELLEEKLAPLLSGRLLSQEFLSAREALSRISFEIWRGHPWLGTGLGSFSIDLGLNARAEDWKLVPAVQTAPLNGFWLLLAERGVIGAFLLAVPLVLLLVTYVRNLIAGIRSLPGPIALAFPLLLAVGCAEMMVDCSVLTPKALVPLLAAAAISARAFVKEKGR